MRQASDYTRARNILSVSIRDSPADSPEHARAVQLVGSCFVYLTNQGVAQMENGEHAAAQETFEDAKVTMESIPNFRTREYAQLLVNLGVVCGKQGDKQRQLALYEEAKEVYDALGCTADNYPKYTELIASIKKIKSKSCCAIQ